MNQYKDLSIFIPTYKRAGMVKTLACLSEAALKAATLVVRPDEYTTYSDVYGLKAAILGLPAMVNNLSQTRQFILDKAPTRFCMMLDDDLTFYYRPDRTKWHLKPMLPAMFDEMIKEMFDHVLELGLAHCAVSPFEGHSHYLDIWNYNLRYMRC